jgi:hypothetical protein
VAAGAAAGRGRAAPDTLLADSLLADAGLAGAVLAGARRVVPTAPRLPPAGPRSATAQRLLLVALELFATKGFVATSIRDIARAMDLQPASLYTHTPSKDHVLAELVLLGHQAHAAHIRAPWSGHRRIRRHSWRPSWPRTSRSTPAGRCCAS